MKKINIRIGKIFSYKLLLVLVLLATGAFGAYYYFQYRSIMKNPEIVSKQELAWVVNKVGKLMQLPANETPTLATVLDKSALQDQDFFKNAENGDKVLVYEQAKKAILYRPDTNRIIEVMPVYEDNQSNAISNFPRVALYNGSVATGLTGEAEDKIQTAIANVKIVLKKDAVKKDYKNTIVAVLNSSMATQAQTIANAVGGQVGELPDQEERPDDIDIVVILSK